MKVSIRGRVSKKDIDEALRSKIRKDTLFCMDSHRNFNAFTNHEGLEQNKIKVGYNRYTNDQVYHVQTVNSKTSRLKTWIRDFNGTSAKYLQTYLRWFITLEKLRDKSLPLKTYALLATSKALLMDDLKITFINHAYI